MSVKSIWNGKEEIVNQMIIENNRMECKKILDRAKKCSRAIRLKERPFCKKVVLYTMKGYNLSNPKDLLTLHENGDVYLMLGVILECFKMIAERNQTFLEVE